MYIRKLENGTYQVTIEAPRDPKTGKRKQITRKHKHRREAIKRAEEEYEKRLNIYGTWGEIDLSKKTFREVAEMFLEEYKNKEKVSTYNSRLTSIKKVYNYFDSIEISKINHKMVQHMVDDMLLNPPIYSLSYTQTIKGTFNLVMDYAVKNGIIKVNPGIGVRYPKKIMTVEELERDDFLDTALTKTDIRKILKEFQRDRYKYKDSFEFYHVMYYTGMRPGEVMALKYDDFDFNKNVVRVSKTLYNPNEKRKGHQLIPPKNNKSRLISFSPKLAEIIKPLIEKKKELKRIFGDSYIDENFIFCDNFGDPYKHGINTKRFKNCLKAVNIDQNKYTPHSFRHAHVTMLVSAEVDIKIAQERLGHKNIKTTLGVYTHITNQMRKRNFIKMNDHMELALDLSEPKKIIISRGRYVVQTLYYK